MKTALHHKSLESQIVYYTEPDRVRLNRAIEAAQARVGNAEDGAALPPPDFPSPTASRTSIRSAFCPARTPDC